MFCQARDDVEAVGKIAEILPKMHSIVIGPGLGRDEHLLKVVKVGDFLTFVLCVLIFTFHSLFSVNKYA